MRIMRPCSTLQRRFSAEAREQRNNVKVNYFEAAKAIAEKAKAIRGDKPDNTLNYLLDSIQYNLDTYFQQ